MRWWAKNPQAPPFKEIPSKKNTNRAFFIVPVATRWLRVELRKKNGEFSCFVDLKKIWNKASEHVNKFIIHNVIRSCNRWLGRMHFKWVHFKPPGYVLTGVMCVTYTAWLLHKMASCWSPARRVESLFTRYAKKPGLSYPHPCNLFFNLLHLQSVYQNPRQLRYFSLQWQTTSPPSSEFVPTKPSA